jgi:hypothetical protein
MSATSLADGFGRNLSSYGTAGNMLSGTKEFLGSNSAVAKIAFLLLAIIVFTTLLRVGTQLLAFLFTPSGSPVLVNGLLNGDSSKVINTDPSKSNSIPILRSKNENEGLEFTYSVWLNISSLTSGNGQYRHIFHKGNNKLDSTGMNDPNNSPGLYLHPTKNALVIVMDTFNSIGERIVVDNIPMKKWINVVIRVSGKNVDVYINGTLVHRHVLTDVPKQNYGNVYVHQGQTFPGTTSSLRYFNYALTVSEIADIVQKGPNMKADSSMFIFPPYFSFNWYLNQ